MNNEQAKQLCLSLMHADTEDAVITALKTADYWDNPAVWRLYGDIESNYSTIGNQQSRPDAALVEKLVNSVDARLMNESLPRRIAPEGQQAPQTIQQAVARFFDEGARPDSPRAGRIREWPETKRTEVARGITLSATGAKPGDGKPCFTISDCGEGQTSTAVPLTLLSLPTGADQAPNFGEVLRFSSDQMPIFPEGRKAYSGSSGWGTLIKLYEYAAAGYSNTHILRRDGLLSRLD